MSTTFSSTFRQSAGFLKQEGRALAGDGKDILATAWGLIAKPETRSRIGQSLKTWWLKNKAQRLCDRLNDQIRRDFILSLSRSDFSRSPTSESATRDYIYQSREYTKGAFKISRWLSARPFISIAGLMGGSMAMSMFVTPFLSFIPLMTFILSKQGENKTRLKLKKFEEEFKSSGLKTPVYFSVNDKGEITHNNHIIKNTAILSFEDTDGQTPLGKNFGLINAFPVHFTDRPEYIFSRFNPEAKTFGRPEHISAFGYEAIVTGYNPDKRGGLTLSRIDWIKGKFRYQSERDFIYLSTLVFPEKTFSEHVSSLKNLRKETLPFSINKDHRVELPAHEAIVRALTPASHYNLSNLAGNVSLDNLKDYASGFKEQTKEQAGAIMAMMALPAFRENMSLSKIADIAGNMGPYALSNISRGGEFPMVFPEYLTKGYSDWGDVFAHEWQSEKIHTRFTAAQVEDMARHYTSWGERAFRLAKQQDGKKINYTDLKKTAQTRLSDDSRSLFTEKGPARLERTLLSVHPERIPQPE